MRYVHLRLTPATLQEGLAKAHTQLAKSGDVEVSLALGGGHYTLTDLVAWDAAE